MKHKIQIVETYYSRSKSYGWSRGETNVYFYYRKRGFRFKEETDNRGDDEYSLDILTNEQIKELRNAVNSSSSGSWSNDTSYHDDVHLDKTHFDKFSELHDLVAAKKDDELHDTWQLTVHIAKHQYGKFLERLYKVLQR